MMKLEMDRIYRKTPLDEIPWNIETPPSQLVQLIDGGKVKPCKTIDFGCGTGNYVSPTAIKTAKENAKKKKVKCDFLVADVLGDLFEVKEKFDFAYDWELLHHIFPEQRLLYVENVYKLLNPGGKYLSVCFSKEDESFSGSGNYRVTGLETVLYFSSESELRSLFEPFFKIEELKTIAIIGRPKSHLAIYAFMERRRAANR